MERAQQRAPVVPVDLGDDVEPLSIGRQHIGLRDRRMPPCLAPRGSRRDAGPSRRSPSSARRSVPRRASRSPPRCPMRPSRAACRPGRPTAGCRVRPAPRARFACGSRLVIVPSAPITALRCAFSSRFAVTISPGAGSSASRSATATPSAGTISAVDRCRPSASVRSSGRGAADGLATTSAVSISPFGRPRSIADIAARCAAPASLSTLPKSLARVARRLGDAGAGQGCRGTRSSAPAARPVPG
jgi:hypothetical protein